MNINKKGINDIITTVLIILLVLAAVAIIGGIILRNLGQAGKQINEQVACNTNIVEPVSCVVILISSNYVTNAIIKRTIIATGSQLKDVNAKFFDKNNIEVSLRYTPNVDKLTNNGDTTEARTSGESTDLMKGGKIVIKTTYILSDGSTATCSSIPLICI